MKGRKVSALHPSLTSLKQSLLTPDTGWKCCKTRVLTFDEFLSIPPCATGQHATVVETPAAPPQAQAKDIGISAPATNSTSGADSSLRQASNAGLVTAPEPSALPSVSSEFEPESDDPSVPIPPNLKCRRRGCKSTSPADLDPSARTNEQCIYHSGQPIFHEGSKGWTCCKRRVLEFDEFMRIEGCQQKERHLFIGTVKRGGAEEAVSDVR